MPLVLDRELPVYRLLLTQSPELLADERALQTEQVHDLLLLNLMSDKVGTELQYLRCLGAARQVIRVELMRQTTFCSPNQDEAYLRRFYLSLEDVRHRHYDAMVITGAPLEHIACEETFFWEEFCRILDWSRTHVHAVMCTCWSAFADVYYRFGVAKTSLYTKLLGIYDLQLHCPDEPLFAGCGADLCVPLSRATDMDAAALLKNPQLILLASACNGSPVYLKTADNRRFYITGHPEYERERLAVEYERDRSKKYAWEVPLPCNYFPNDDTTQPPTDRWIADCRQIFSNWLSFYVDKATAINR